MLIISFRKVAGTSALSLAPEKSIFLCHLVSEVFSGAAKVPKTKRISLVNHNPKLHDPIVSLKLINFKKEICRSHVD